MIMKRLIINYLLYFIHLYTEYKIYNNEDIYIFKYKYIPIIKYITKINNFSVLILGIIFSPILFLIYLVSEKIDINFDEIEKQLLK